jgi:hypothetical protein
VNISTDLPQTYSMYAILNMHALYD